MITREWRRPGLKFSHKRKPNEELKFIRHQETARNTGRARQMHRGRGDEEHDATTRYRQGTGPPVEAGKGGGGGWSQAERGRDPWIGETLGQQGPDCAGKGW